MWSDRCLAAVHREMNCTLPRSFYSHFKTQQTTALCSVYLASSEDKRGREEKNARLILRMTAAVFSLAFPNICESRGWEEAQDNL